jgi:hypothetical protein
MPAVKLAQRVSVTPISRASPIVCDRKHGDVIPQPNKDHMVRKIVHGKLAHIRVANTWNKTARARESLEVFKSLPHFSCETARDVFISLAVPRDRFSKLAASPRTQPYFQRDSTSR